MSDKLRSPSRRALLKMAAASPLALLGAEPMPPEMESRLRALAAKSSATDDDFKEAMKIGQRLWSLFLLGVGKNIVIGDGVYNEAVDKSGGPILQKVKEKKFPKDKDHDPTIVCAIRCGVLASQKAINVDGTKAVTKDVFIAAWNETRTWMLTLMTRTGNVDDDQPFEGQAYAC